MKCVISAEVRSVLNNLKRNFVIKNETNRAARHAMAYARYVRKKRNSNSQSKLYKPKVTVEWLAMFESPRDQIPFLTSLHDVPHFLLYNRYTYAKISSFDVRIVIQTPSYIMESIETILLNKWRTSQSTNSAVGQSVVSCTCRRYCWKKKRLEPYIREQQLIYVY
jgi:hypothetical protein